MAPETGVRFSPGTESRMCTRGQRCMEDMGITFESLHPSHVRSDFENVFA